MGNDHLWSGESSIFPGGADVIHYPDMPRIIPIPAQTKGLPWWKASWNWLTVPTFWMLAEDYGYRLIDETEVFFPWGFRFDGASAPRPFWPLINPDGIMFIQGMIHDFGFRFDCLLHLDRSSYMPGAGMRFWNQMFYDEGNVINGMKPLNYTAWVALESFGWIAWNKWRARNESV